MFYPFIDARLYTVTQSTDKGTLKMNNCAKIHVKGIDGNFW